MVKNLYFPLHKPAEIRYHFINSPVPATNPRHYFRRAAPLKLKLNPDRQTALLVDEHPLWLDAVTRVLERIDVTVVASSTSPQHALKLLAEHAPGLLVIGLDGHESDVDALTFLRSAREQLPDVRAIVLSAYRDPERIEAALQSGAVAYVVKTVEAEDLAYAMRQAFTHSVYVAANPAVAAQTWSPPAGSTAAGSVTRREADILRLVAEGHSNAEVARMLWIAEQTVKFHLSNIYRKLNVSNRTEAARWAQLHGLLTGRPAPARADLNVA
jgi:two-component system response regulator DevR